MQAKVREIPPVPRKFDITLSGLTLEQAEQIEQLMWAFASYMSMPTSDYNHPLIHLANNISCGLNEHREQKPVQNC